GPSYIPVIAAIGMLVASIATLAQFYLVAVAGVVFTLIVAVVWLWPKDDELEEIRKTGIERKTGLTLEPTGSASSGWWAMAGVLSVLGTLFAVLYYSYFYLRLYSPAWPQGGIPKPGLLVPGLVYLLLPAGALGLHLAGRGRSRRSVKE